MTLNYSDVLPPLESSPLKNPNKITFNIKQKKPVKNDVAHTSDIKDTTLINMDGTGSMANIKAETLHTVMAEAVDKAPNHIALKYKFSHEEKYISMTFSDYYRLCCMAAKSLIQLGLQPRHSVCISGFNAPPWFLSYFGTIFAAGVASGIFTTNNAESVQYILQNCSCQIAIVENNELLLRYYGMKKELTKLKAIVQYKGSIDTDLTAKWNMKLYDWNKFMQLGLNVSDESLVERIQSLIPNECCSLLYTSGTTGSLKGVMASHDNLIWTARTSIKYLNFLVLKEHFISYLPLSHVAAQLIDCIAPLILLATVTFSQPDALKGTLGRTLREVRPTRLFGVPMVWEKISSQISEFDLTMSKRKQKICNWAKGIGTKAVIARTEKKPKPCWFSLAKFLVFNKVKANLGLDRCLSFYSTAAPLSNSVMNHFASLNIIICEIYGMSECTGPHCIGIKKEVIFGSVGKIMDGVDIKIDIKDDKSTEGEVCLKGRHIFMGYLGCKDKTDETFDADGWLHSGDIGTMNDDGYLFITGRIKELIINAAGENVAPVPIEENIKLNMPLLSNAMVVGDKKKFLSVLLTIKCEINAETQYPTDNLTAAAKRWCQSIDYNVTNVSQVISDMHPGVVAAIDGALTRANDKAFSKTEYIDKWRFLPCDFSIGGGELGPTMKLKRAVVMHMYASIIDELYKA